MDFRFRLDLEIGDELTYDNTSLINKNIILADVSICLDKTSIKDCPKIWKESFDHKDEPYQFRYEIKSYEEAVGTEKSFGKNILKAMV